MTPVIAKDLDELAAARARLGRLALVPTMGALHEGHRSLIRAAHRHADAVAVSIFVNPRQFGPGEDFDRYPRTLDEDLQVCADDGVALVFAPQVDVVYPRPPMVTVSPGELGTRYEGAARPGHFAGVLTVVAKLFGMIRPDVALFGEKDAQQLALIRLMVADLDMPVEIVSCPIVREPDGLAMSSRNRYLSPAERTTALALSRALRAGVRAAESGGSAGDTAGAAAGGTAGAPGDGDGDRTDGPAGPKAGAGTGLAAVRAAAQAVLDEAAEADPPLELDYLITVDPDDFTELPEDHRGTGLLAVAGRVGTTRLIDNMRFTVGGR